MMARRLDPDAIVAKLHKMRQFHRRLSELGPATPEEFAADFDRQIMSERLFSGLIDMSVSINTHISTAMRQSSPITYKESFRTVAELGVIDGSLATALDGSTGLRNIIVHDYMELDLKRFGESIPLATEHYGEYIRQVSRWLKDRLEPQDE